MRIHRIRATGLKHLREAVAFDAVVLADNVREIAADVLGRSSSSLHIDSRRELEAVMLLMQAARKPIFWGRPSWISVIEDLLNAAEREGASDLGAMIFPVEFAIFRRA